MECKDGYCTYWRECRHCGDFIKRKETTNQVGLHNQAICDACWSDAIHWHLQGVSPSKIAEQLAVDVSTIRSYLIRRHFLPGEALQKARQKRKNNKKQQTNPEENIQRAKAYQSTERGKLWRASTLTGRPVGRPPIPKQFGPPRPVGRPRKYPVGQEPPKRPVGRPRKALANNRQEKEFANNV